MAYKIHISWGAYFVWALLLFLLPVPWCIGALVAAFVHELGHLITLSVLKTSICRVEIHSTGAVIHAGPMSRGVELICTLAGPAASLVLAYAVKQYFPEMALFALTQGLFNLLPISGLDGGRALSCITSEALCRAVEMLTLILLWGLGIWAGLGRGLCGLTLLPAMAATIRRIPGKFPCKESCFAVQ